LEQQRKEGSGSDKKKEEFYLRKIKEIKSQKDDIEKQMGSQKEQRDQLEMKIEDSKKEMD
jgi:structural maintenance of chromosome 2